VASRHHHGLLDTCSEGLHYRCECRPDVRSVGREVSMGSARFRVRGRGAAGFAVAVVVSAVLVSAPPAGALAAHRFPQAAPKHRHVAGYLQNAIGTNDGVSLRFKVPTVTCPAAGAPGFAGTAMGAVVYTASGFTEAAIGVTCFGADAHYAGLATINSTPTQLPDAVSPGDSITVRAIEGAVGGATAMVKNTTRHWSHTLTGTGLTATEIGAGAIAFACGPTGCSPVPEFTSVKFTAVTYDGGGVAPDALRSKLKAADGSIEAKPSGLNSGSDAFTAKWVSTCSPVDANGHC
jgi:Peptidase A4 family